MSIQNQALGKVSWDVKDCRQDCRRLAEDTWGVLGKAERFPFCLLLSILPCQDL
jgi:hypothetical protein